MKNTFSHLRVSSEYSITQGLLTINQIVDSAVKNTIPSVALTDKSNMFGLVKFFNKCEAAGIKPISGSSIRVIFDDDEHSHELLCLAKTNTGHKNLMKIISSAHNNYTYQSPIINFNDLIKLKDDIIVISGGKDSHVFELLKRNRPKDAEKIIDSFLKVFDDDFILEVQKTNRSDEFEYFSNILPIATAKGIPLIATNDVLFAKPDDFDTHETKVCINTGKTLNDPNREKLFSQEQYFKSSDDMAELFKGFDSLLDNTNEISKKCNVSIHTKQYFLPEYPVPEDHNFDSYLVDLSKKRLQDYINNFNSEKNKIYTDRLDYELNQIKTMGFSSYFLIVYDFIQWSKNNDVPVGPGRGSGAGSLVAFALGITTLDPIDHGLLFERFLNPERVSMPDFDIDFCQLKRDQVIDHVQDVYGKDRVAQIITFGSLQARGVLRDVGRVLEIPYGKVDELCRLVPNNPAEPTTLQKALDIEPKLVAAMQTGEEISQLFEISLKLEGLYKNAATHAAGLVIGDKPLVEILPLYKDPKSNLPATQFNMKYTELSGLVKFDFLGLKTLSILDMATKLLKKYNPSFKLEDISLNDDKTYKEISSGNTVGIFQLESQGMRDVLVKLKPDRFEEIIAVVALYRPGPMDNIPSFINRKHGFEKVEVLHPLLKAILDETYGIMIYQEQVMEAAQKLSGYSLGQADLLRRAMGKKIKSEMEAQKEIFVEGASNNNIDKNLASKIFELIARFAGYGFNKSHAAAYALIACQTAWFKANHPEIFLSSLMTFDSDLSDKINIYSNELTRLGISLLGPDVNYSKLSYDLEESLEGELSIRTGLCGIKNVGDKALNSIIDERDNNGLFNNLLEFASRINDGLLGKSHYEHLASSGAFVSICSNRHKAFMSAQILVDISASSSVDKYSQQQNIFGESTDLSEIWKLPNVDDWNVKDILEKERTTLGFYYSGHPLNYFDSFFKHLNIKDISKINTDVDFMFDSVGVVVQVSESSSRNGRFARVLLSNKSSLTEVSIYSDIYSNKKELLKLGTVIYLTISVMKAPNNRNRFLVKDIYLLEDQINSLITLFEITLKSDINIKKFINNFKSNIEIDQNSYKCLLHFIFEDGDNNIVKVETKEYIKSPILFLKKIASLYDVISINPIIKK